MSAIINLSIQQLRHIANLKEKIESLEHELSRLVNGAVTTAKRGFRISAAGRARIAAAQRARWAKAGKRSGKTARKSGRTLSSAAKAKIAAAARARWAKAKAAGKKRL